MKIWTSILIFVFVGQLASANTAIVQFDSINTGKIVQIYSGGHNWESAYAGVYNLIVDEKKVTGTCVDLGQWVSYSPQKYDVVKLSKVPTPGDPMGLLKSWYVEELYQKFYNPKWNIKESEEAAAFQCAVWELIYEDYNKDPSLYNVSKVGSYEKSGFACKGINYKLANEWLSGLEGDEYPFRNSKIMALSSGNFQDYIAVNVPEPATILILCIGFMFCLVKRTYGRK